MLVIGAGFTGSEIASVCRERDLPVTVAERGPTLSGALGNVIGDVAAQLHHQHGVDLRCGVMVTGLEGDGAGRLRRAHFSDGGTVDAEVAVVALGATHNTEWLAGSGLAAGAARDRLRRGLPGLRRTGHRRRRCLRRGRRRPLPASAVRLPVPVPGALGQRGRAGRGRRPQHDLPW
ncbi:hypothetical protein SANTM175S_04739 [Streptomyces antimycoticus]